MLVRVAVLIAFLAGCSAPALRVVDDAERDAGTTDVVRDDDVRLVPRATASCPDPSERGCQRVYVSAGRMTLGSDSAGAAGPAQPSIEVSAFVVDAAEVTVARFERFAAAHRAGSLPPTITLAYPNGATISFPRSRLPMADLLPALAVCNRPDNPNPGVREHPINCVDWYIALAFCAWDGARLPTEAESEWVARWWRATTPEGRRYPWGEALPSGRCDLAHWMERSTGGLCVGMDGRGSRRVMSLSAGQTFGVYDLAGNAAEWVADTFLDYRSAAMPNDCWGRGPQRNPLCDLVTPVLRGVRGGSAATLATDVDRLLTVSRRFAATESVDYRNGFRCVRAPATEGLP